MSDPQTPTPAETPTTTTDAAHLGEPVEVEAPPKRRPLLSRVSDKFLFFATSLGQQGLRIGTTLVMARNVPSTDYGLLTTALAGSAVVTALGDLGISRALVQLPDVDKRALDDTGLVVTGVIAAVYATACVVSAANVAHYFHDPRLLWVGVIAGVSTALGMIYQFQMACLNRDMRFRAESLQNLIFSVAQAATGITLALMHFGLFALVIQPLMAQVLASAAMYRRHPPRWPRQVSLSVVWRLFGFGWQMTLASYVHGLQMNVANLILVSAGAGRAEEVRTRRVGDFGRAVQVRELFGHNIISQFDRMLYPGLAAARDDRVRLRDLYLRSTIAQTFICGAATAWLYGTAPDLIRIVLGANWAPVPPVLQILSLGLIAAVPMLMTMLVNFAIGRPLFTLWFTGLQLVLTAGSFWVAREYGLETSAWALVGTQYVVAAAALGWAVVGLGVSLGSFFARLAPLIVATAAATLATHYLRTGILAPLPALPRLIVASLLCGVVYLGLAHLLDRRLIPDIKQMVTGGRNR